MKLKRVKDFLTESIENVHEGDFGVTKDMFSEGKFIEGKIPKVINGDFNCSYNNLTTLEGGPEEVNGNFICYGNNITSLEFCPKEVNGVFNCSDNKLTSLEFRPEKIGGSFHCSYNQLTSLEFGPKIVNGVFDCTFNKLTSLEFGPKEVNGYFHCSNNQLTSLEFGPKIVNKDLYCSGNVNNLEIEKDFINTGMFKNDYYADLLDYMISNDIDIEEVKSWPEGFITNNMKINNKNSNKFNL